MEQSKSRSYERRRRTDAMNNWPTEGGRQAGRQCSDADRFSRKSVVIDPRFIGRVFPLNCRMSVARRASLQAWWCHPVGRVSSLDDEQNLFLVRQHRVGPDTTRELPAVNWISPKIRSNVPGESSPRNERHR